MSDDMDKIHAIARSLLDEVKAIGEKRTGAAAPADTQVCLAVMAVAFEASRDSGQAAFPGMARALASLAVAENISEKRLIRALRNCWEPTFRTAHQR